MNFKMKKISNYKAPKNHFFANIFNNFFKHMYKGTNEPTDTYNREDTPLKKGLI